MNEFTVVCFVLLAIDYQGGCVLRLLEPKPAVRHLLQKLGFDANSTVWFCRDLQ